MVSLPTPAAAPEVPAPSCTAGLALCCHLLPGDSARRQPRPLRLELRAQDAGVLTACPRSPLEAAVSLPQTLPPPRVLRKCNSQDATDGGSPEGPEKGLFSSPLPSVPQREQRAGDGHLHDSNDMAGFLKFLESPKKAGGEQEHHPPQGPPSAGAARPRVRRRDPSLEGLGGQLSLPPSPGSLLGAACCSLFPASSQ